MKSRFSARGSIARPAWSDAAARRAALVHLPRCRRPRRGLTQAWPVVIPAGQATATVTIAPTNDTANEGEESATLTLTADAAYVIGTANVAAAKNIEKY